MILVDTSVWIEHLRAGDETLVAHLDGNQVLMHPFVLGELACGNLQNRAKVLALLKALPESTVADDEDVLFFIERHELMGRGIGYVDAHLLAAVTLVGSAQLWTWDKPLRTAANVLALAYTGPESGSHESP